MSARAKKFVVSVPVPVPAYTKWNRHYQKHPNSPVNVSFHPNSSCCRPTLMTTVTHAFSLSGSAPEYSSAGELVDTGRKERRKRIAGIDQDELLDPKLLADPDSCFCEFQGVEIHHMLYDQDQTQTPSLKRGLPMILLHGFGASVFSWTKVMKRLANLTGSKVLAFDRPAFGLTSRLNTFGTKANDVNPQNPYSMAFSVLATLYFIDFLAAEKAILVGYAERLFLFLCSTLVNTNTSFFRRDRHSAGSLVAVDAYFEAPERVAALILVAPAILAPRAIPKTKVVETKGDRSDSNNLPKPPFSVFRRAVQVYQVRMIIDKFGVAAVRMAWYDSKQVDEHIIDGYTKPLRTKGWDKALVEFTAAMLLKGESERKPPLSKRLHEISCPVLIVKGDTDRIVPSWNAKRLSRAIPRSKLEVIKNCGHLPLEEKVDEFVRIIDKFLHRAFGGLEEHFVQAVT
ncbi:hypothetical protein V6N12_053170 [Hibiscus sabdariffa]|uniref:Serine aminopeptidase S33 domain-containing protein n=1 Tax=Hibiscus sabdariffa TaxID=183260 RepID=A0ABR2D6U2_9ROSI